MTSARSFELLVADLGLDAGEVRRRRRSFGLGDAEEATLTTLGGALHPARDGFVRGFYDFLRRFDETAVLLEKPGLGDRLAQTQTAYFERLTRGGYDLDYALDRIRVGVAHQRVGLGPKWYLGGFNRYLSALVPALPAAVDGSQGWLAAVQALVRIVFFDISLALEAYQLERRQALTTGRKDEPDLDAAWTADLTGSVVVDVDEAVDVVRILGLDQSEIARRRSFLGIEPGDPCRTRPWIDALREEIPTLMDRVTAHLDDDSRALSWTGSASIEAMVRGSVTRNRVRDRVGQGLFLGRAGLPLGRCLASHAWLLGEFAARVLDTAGGDLDRASLAFCHLQREAFFDLGIIVDALSYEAERPLREVREAAKAVTQSLPSGLLTVDARLGIESANPRACAILGKPAIELVGTPLRSALAAPLLLERVEDVLDDAEPRGEIFVDVAGPPRCLLRFAVSPLASDAPGGRRLLIAIDDVTGVTRLRQDVERSEQWFRTLVEGLDVAVCETRVDPVTVTFASPQVERIFGVRPEDWLRSMSAWLDRVHPEDRGTLDASADRLDRGPPGTTDRVVYRFDAGDRGDVWVEHRSLVTLDSQGLRVVRTVLLDVTSIKEAELELRRERNFVRSLLDTAGAAVLVLDPQGTILEFNVAAEELYGRTRSEVTGLDYVRTLIPAAGQAEVSSRFESLRSGGKVRGFEGVVQAPGGRRRTVLWNADRLVSEDGSFRGSVAVGVDVTGRRAAEEKLHSAHEELLVAHKKIARERRKMAQTERLSSVGLLAAGVAHEINNPLGGVIACVDSLQQGTLSATRSEEYFAAVQDGLNRIRSTVSGLLNFSRQRPGVPESVKLQEIVDACLRLSGPSVRENGVRIDWTISEVGPRAFADRSQVLQAVLNILLNAFQAIGPEGVVQISGPVRPGQVGVKVKDDGPGIAAKILDRVCDPFFTTKREGAGTGLGLAVTLGLAKANGGDLEISSVEGQGCAVTIWLPVAEP